MGSKGTPSSKGTDSSRKTGGSKSDPSDGSDVTVDNELRLTTSQAKYSLNSSQRRKKFRKTPLFCSCRLILTVVSCLGFVNMYIMRFNFNVAMSWMINSTAIAELKRLGQLETSNAPPMRPKGCEETDKNQQDRLRKFTKEKRGEFVWSGKVQSLLSSSFFWGYLVTQIPGGWLSERYGGKMFFGLAIFGSGIVNLLIPYAARLNYKALIVIRVTLGVLQGVCWPAMNVIWSRWAPPLERQKLTSLSYTGSLLGMVITFPTTTLICDAEFGEGWPNVFYATGGIGIVWFLLWSYFVYDSPELHPRISKAEKEYICSHLDKNISMSLKKHAPTPWLSILTSKAVWGLMIVHTLANFTLYTLIANISKYMQHALYFDIEQTGPISAVPYVGFFMMSVTSGVLFDVVLSKKYVSRTTARKTGNTIGTLIPGILIFGASFFDCTNRMIPLLLLIICISICGFQYGSGFLTNFIDIAPQHVGVLFGISNTVATLSGISAPLLTHAILTDNLPSQWQLVLKVIAGIFVGDSIVFTLLGSGEIQKWAQYVSDDEDGDISPDLSIRRKS